MRERGPDPAARVVNRAEGQIGNLVQAGHIDQVVFPPPERVGVAVVHRVRESETAGEVFVGRAQVVEQVATAYERGVGGVVLAGMGGVGKTTVAQHAAVQVVRQEWFPGGVFWVDMHGYSAERQVPASAVFGPLLRVFGVPGEQIPTDTGEQAAVYGQVLDQFAAQDSGVLLVFDNVAAGDQVRDLLPRQAPHRWLVTTRDTLHLPAAARVDLDVLASAEACALLDEVLGTASDPHELAAACGGLPLALRIAAALLLDEPELTPGELARQLRQAPGVEGYARGEQALAAVFDWSWLRLVEHHPDRARLLRLVCVAPGPDVSTASAAVLAECQVDQARVALRGLRHAYLLRPTGSDRWGPHDLIRAHTTNREAPGLDATGLAASRARLFEHFAQTANAADERLRALPGDRVEGRFADSVEALQWLDAERACLVDAVIEAATTDDHEHAARLGTALSTYLTWRWYLTDLVTVATHARASATHLDRGTFANCTVILANALSRSRRFDEAVVLQVSAATVYSEAGDAGGEAATWNNLGNILLNLRRIGESVQAHARARELYRAIGDPRNEGAALSNLGLALHESRRFEEALAVLEHASELFGDLGDRRGEMVARASAGAVLREVGRLDEAAVALQIALDAALEMEDVYSEATARDNLAATIASAGRPGEAIAVYERNLALAERLGDRHMEGLTWNNLGSTFREAGQLDRAVVAHGRAEELFRANGERYLEAAAANNAAVAQLDAQLFQAAADTLLRTEQLFLDSGDGGGVAVVLQNLGRAMWGLERPTEAKAYWSRARTAFLELGDVAGAARMEQNLRREIG
ncbi:tetratricopeptide (TPR) repeat protein [Actinokineospora baliensis]|uniref:tetratricopeptide repeat protein n=1 Tax=Actinokineospora baliensis TaxID=547056 RepID=UPI00195B87F5|nr:tetratricopeptide repeat protein [Actinokineospora baliensis]MBM7773474.1 tetratricopeptide (TPR) repeat protein [Actinokineospora baliensis]